MKQGERIDFLVPTLCVGTHTELELNRQLNRIARLILAGTTIGDSIIGRRGIFKTERSSVIDAHG